MPQGYILPRKPPNRGPRRGKDRLVAAYSEVGYFRGVAEVGSIATTPDHSSLDLTGDIDLRCCAWIFDNTNTPHLIGKGDTSPTYLMQVATATTRMDFIWRSGAANLNQDSGLGLIVTTAPRWYRGTLDVDDGAGNRVVTFYYSDQSPSTDPAAVLWTEFSQHITAGTTSVDVSAFALSAGARANGSRRLDGLIYYAEVRNGIGGTLVARPDFRDRDQFTTLTTLTDTPGRVWTVVSAASWVLPKQLSLTAANVSFYPHFPSKNRTLRIRGR